MAGQYSRDGDTADIWMRHGLQLFGRMGFVDSSERLLHICSALKAAGASHEGFGGNGLKETLQKFCILGLVFHSQICYSIKLKCSALRSGGSQEERFGKDWEARTRHRSF